MKAFFVIACLGSALVCLALNGCNRQENAGENVVSNVREVATPSPAQIAAYEKERAPFLSPYYAAAKEWEKLRTAHSNADSTIGLWLSRARDKWKDVRDRNYSKGNSEDALEKVTKDDRERMQPLLKEMKANLHAMPALSRRLPAEKQKQLTIQINLIDRSVNFLRTALKNYDVKAVEKNWANINRTLRTIKHLYPTEQLNTNFQTNYTPMPRSQETQRMIKESERRFGKQPEPL